MERFLSIVSRSWLEFAKLAVGVGVVYFLAARLSFVLRVEPGVVVFWPAAGIAAGALIALGPRARLPVAIAAFGATVAHNLMVGRNPWLTVAFSVVGAGHPMLMAWLIGRWFEGTFKLEDVWRALGFFAATAIGAAIAAAGATVAITLVDPTVSPLYIWCVWFASSSLGIVTVAPLLIGLAGPDRERLSRQALIEGLVAVATITMLTGLLISLPNGPWATALPEALVFPLLLWIAIRCRPIFAAAAALAIGLAVIGSTTLNVGYFDWGKPLTDRILSAQIFVLTEAMLAVLMAAVFAERRRTEADLKRSEAELKQSNNRLQLALDCAELGTWSLQLSTGRFENDVRDRRIHGHGQEAPPKTLAEMRCQVHPGDLSKLDATFRELRHAGGSSRAEYRLAPRTDQEDAGRERWVTLEGTVVRRADGRPEQFLGVTRDITERKHAENALRTSEERLRRVSDNADVGLIRCSHDWYYLSANPAYAKIVGKPLDQIVGLPMAEVMGAEAVETIRPYVERVLRGEHVIYEAEVPYAGAGTRYMHVSYTPDTDAAGQIVGWVACVTDITERKHAEDALHQREVELGEAQRLAHIGSWFWEAETDALVASDELLRIYGRDPETQRVLTLHDQRGRWHPADDWERLNAAIQKTMQTGLGYKLDLQAFRNETPIWITARGAAVCNAKGQIVGLRGTVQDITERKQAEQALAERNAQLGLAGRAARVGSYAYDVEKGTMQISEGYAAIHGLPMGTTETSYKEWRTRVHPDDLKLAEDAREQAFASRSKEDNAEYRIVLATGEIRWIERRGWISYDENGQPERVVGVNIDVTGRKRGDERQRILLAELDHRVKNTLATISSVVSQTAVGRTSVAKFVNALDGRLRSMATTHELLSSGRWRGASLTELVQQELAPYATRHNTKISGPEVVLRPEVGQAIAMVLHELATNAAKYGALSTRQGRVSLRWERQLNGYPGGLVLEWQEFDGPQVVVPSRAGFGMSTIRDLIPYEFGGSVDLAFLPTGVQCRIELPANWLTHSDEDPVPNISHSSPAAGNP